MALQDEQPSGKKDALVHHNARAYASLGKFRDGGETHVSLIREIMREGRCDDEAGEINIRLTKDEMLKPEEMSLTRLRKELQERGLYQKNQPRWALVTTMQDVVRSESRILRLSQALRSHLTRPSRATASAVKQTISENRGKLRRTLRFAGRQIQEDNAKRATEKSKLVFLSCAELDAALSKGTCTRDEAMQGIFLFDLKREWVFRRDDNPLVKKDRIDEKYFLVSPELLEIIWRKEEKREIIWMRGLKWSEVSSRLSRMRVGGKRLENLKLRKEWWHRTWKKSLPLHKEMYVSSKEKVLHVIASNTFDVRVVAEIIYQSNPRHVQIFGIDSLEHRRKKMKRLKLRLPSDRDSSGCEGAATSS